MNIIELKNTRRFYRDESHAYGWSVGFKTTITDGVKKKRIHISDIGTDRRAAISNGLRLVGHYQTGTYKL